MKVFIKVILAGLLTLSFTACGGGGSSNSGGGDTGTNPPTAPVTGNASLSSGENNLGYYGDNVLFGDTIVAGEWLIDLDNLSDGNIGPKMEYGDIYFYADGTIDHGSYSPCTDPDTHKYGLSDDKNSITLGTGACANEDGGLIPTKSFFVRIDLVNKTSDSCYNIIEIFLEDGTSTTGTFCKI